MKCDRVGHLSVSERIEGTRERWGGLVLLARIIGPKSQGTMRRKKEQSENERVSKTPGSH